MTALQDDGPAITSPTKGPLPAYVAMGLLQGITLWLLSRPETASAFSNRMALFSASIRFAVAAPVVWYLLASSPLRPLARAGVAVAIAALVGALGAHATATSGAGSEPPSFTLASAVMSYMLVALAAGSDTRQRWFDYRQLFEHAWRNAFLLAAAGALTGILWTLLYGAAFMLSALHLEAMLNLLREPSVIAVLSCTAFAFFLLQAMLRGEALGVLRKFWLTLNTWFLPLALLLAIVWVCALLATGPKPLFETRRAALLLFWFVALAVLFMNAAYQDGRVVPYGRAVAAAVPWAWLSVPVLAAIGLWALSLRVAQHGWSLDRLWAALVGGMALLYGVGYAGGMALLYGVGYAASALSRSRWMPTLANTNIVAALALVVAIFVFTGPLADFRRIAVHSQLARLRSGETTAAAFDFASLQRQGGQWGRDALAQLAADPSLPAAARATAKAQLAGTGRYDLDQDPGEALAVLRKDLRILPAGTAPDPRLLELLSRGKAERKEKMCVQQPTACALWMVDLDGDGKPEAVLLSENGGSGQATVYANGRAGWKREAQLQGPYLRLDEWVTAIETETAEPVKPRWPDLQLGTRRFWVRPD